MQKLFIQEAKLKRLYIRALFFLHIALMFQISNKHQLKHQLKWRDSRRALVGCADEGGASFAIDALHPKKGDANFSLNSAKKINQN